MWPLVGTIILAGCIVALVFYARGDSVERLRKKLNKERKQSNGGGWYPK